MPYQRRSVGSERNKMLDSRGRFAANAKGAGKRREKWQAMKVKYGKGDINI